MNFRMQPLFAKLNEDLDVSLNPTNSWIASLRLKLTESFEKKEKKRSQNTVK